MRSVFLTRKYTFFFFVPKTEDFSELAIIEIVGGVKNARFFQ